MKKIKNYYEFTIAQKKNLNDVLFLGFQTQD